MANSRKWFKFTPLRGLFFFLIFGLALFGLLYFTYFAQATLLLLHPSGQNADNRWSLSAGSSWAAALDDNDGDATYAYIDRDGRDLMMNMDNRTTETSAISQVILKGYFRQTTGDERIRLGLQVGGTQYWDSATYQPGTSYTLFSFNATAVRSWSWADIDNTIGMANSIRGGVIGPAR